MAAIIDSRRLGVYCALRLGDDPAHSGTGCRFYVYVGKACAAWLDYHDLDAAMAENPGQPVFERATMADILLEHVQRLSDTTPGSSAVHDDLQYHLLKMLRDLGMQDQMILWHAAQALWCAAKSETGTA